MRLEGGTDLGGQLLCSIKFSVAKEGTLLPRVRSSVFCVMQQAVDLWIFFFFPQHWPFAQAGPLSTRPLPTLLYASIQTPASLQKPAHAPITLCSFLKTQIHIELPHLSSTLDYHHRFP